MRQGGIWAGVLLRLRRVAVLRGRAFRVNSFQGAPSWLAPLLFRTAPASNHARLIYAQVQTKTRPISSIFNLKLKPKLLEGHRYSNSGPQKYVDQAVPHGYQENIHQFEPLYQSAANSSKWAP